MNRHTTAPFVLCLLIFTVISSDAFSDPPTLQEEVTRELAGMQHDKFLTFNHENDLLGGGTDQNYTSGVRVTWYDLGAQLPAFAYTLDRYIPTFSINKTTSVYYTAGQNLYTPEDITQVNQKPGDHPWAGFLYGAAGLTTITRNHVDELEATLGVVGPAALGEQTQKFIHRYISHSPRPMGWHNQLKDEPGLILAWDRRFPTFYGTQALGLHAGAEPDIGVTLGNVYTYANAGVSFRLSPWSGRWQDDPIRVRPSIPGTGAYIVPEHTFSWYLFAGAQGRAVVRDIFLDGNTFADSYSVGKLPFVADLDAGLALTYGRVRMSYALIYRTKEYRTQTDKNVFGTVSLGFRF